MKRSMLLLVMTAAAASIAACAPARFCAGVGYAAEKYRSRNAATLCVKHHSQYRFDTRLRSDLEDAINLVDLDEMKREGERVLCAAQALAVETAGDEIDLMPPKGLAFLTRRYRLGGAINAADEQREILKARFSDESQASLQADLARLRAAGELRSVRTMLQDIDREIEAPVGDRGKLGRILLAAPLFLPATIGAEMADSKATQYVIDASFDQVFVYRPFGAERAQSTEQLESANDEQLAQWFAPVFIQQNDPQAPYPPSEDQFGAVSLNGTPEHIEVRIDIERPTVYWALQEAKIGAGQLGQPLFGRATTASVSSNTAPQRRRQFVYVAWYPSRPTLEPGDSEAGLIDGVVIRITLDSHNRPAIYEFVRSCGCYHMLYVAEFVEAAARRHFGAPLPGKRYALQKADSTRELFIPSLVRDDGSHPTRPVAYVSSGHHMLMGVEAGGMWKGEAKVVSERTYTLERYGTLTRLPLGDGVASMFGSDGLVHSAGRAEGWLLAPTGMRSAGQPRQLGTMKIRMDAYDYDDPYLLDRQLRLPPGF